MELVDLGRGAAEFRAQSAAGLPADEVEELPAAELLETPPHGFLVAASGPAELPGGIATLGDLGVADGEEGGLAGGGAPADGETGALELDAEDADGEVGLELAGLGELEGFDELGLCA